MSFRRAQAAGMLGARSTSVQVLLAIRQGLFDVLRDDRGPRAIVRARDCDEATCTAWYLLQHHALCRQAMNSRLNRLVAFGDALDATAGAYPVPREAPVLRHLAWIFDPYHQARLSGRLDPIDAGRADADRAGAEHRLSLRALVDDVTHRIDQHVAGGGGELSVDLRFERLGGDASWALVREVGAQARTGMLARGIRAFVSARPRADGRWTYVLGRTSPFVRFPIDQICAALNGLGDGAASAPEGDAWEGSDTLGHSPRARGSQFHPDDLTRIVDEVLR